MLDVQIVFSMLLSWITKLKIMEEKYINQIVAYLNNDLSAQDKTAFDQAMASDEDLVAEVQLYRDLYDVHEVIGDEELAASIQGANDVYFNKAATAVPTDTAGSEAKEAPIEGKNVRLKWVLSLAAGFLLLLAVGGWWAGRDYSNEALAANSFTNNQITSFVRSTGDATNDPFAGGLTALNQNNYEDAITFFSAFSEQDASYNEAVLYLALAQFKAGEYANAQSNAQLVIEQSPQFSAKAKWLLVNVLLANGETGNDFQQLLTEMAADEDNPYYQNKAIQLQKKLNVFWRGLTW